MGLKQIVNAMTFKILLAVVLASGMIIAIVNLSRDLHTYLGGFEQGPILQLAAFGLLLIILSASLYYLLKGKDTKATSLQPETFVAALLSSDLKAVGISFIEGFINGLSAQKANNNQPTQKN